VTESWREEAEFAAMRATIRQRGTARMVLAPLVFIGWSGAAIAAVAVIGFALGTLVPLIVLAAGFESLFALHLNVERIGRYLQIFHEPDGGWEHVAMRFGQRYPGAGSDPLFARLFVLATSVNFLPAALGGEPIEIGVLAVLHLAFVYRVRMAQRAAAKQRTEDLARFAALKDEAAP
jgi:hypothetical protein